MNYAPDSPFDILISAVARHSGDGDVSFSLSFRPQYITDDLSVRINIDPSRIRTFRDGSTLRFYWNFFSSFIDEFSYSHKDVFSIRMSDNLIIPSDPFGIASAITGSFHSNEERLPFIATLDTANYSHMISYSDVSLSSQTGFLMYRGNTASQASDLNAGLALLATVNHGDLSQTAFYPQFFVYRDFTDFSGGSLSLQLNSAVRISPEGFDGWGIALSIPLTMKNLSFSSGLALTNGMLQYGEYLNGYHTRRENEDTLMLFSRLLYEIEDFSVVVDMQLPIDLDPFRIIKNEDYFSVEATTNFFGISLEGGFRARGLFTDFSKAVREYREAFVSLGYSNRAISTDISFSIDQNRQSSLTLSATLSSYHALFSRDGKLATSPGWLDIELYTGYMQEPGPSVFLRPVIRFNWSRESNIALRIPLSFSIEDGAITLSSGIRNDDWFNFGFGSDSTFNVVYDFITDLFSLVESIHIGGEDIGIYLNAGRKGTVDISLFSDTYRNYGKENSLSLLFGFSVKEKADVKAFVNNMERPDTFALSIAIMPMGDDGPRLILDTALSILFSEDDYKAETAVGLSLEKDFSAGISSALYVNTYLDFTPHGFNLHITSADDLSLSAGLRFEAQAGHFTFPFSLGFNSGKAREYYFDAFTYRNHEAIDSRPFLEGYHFFLKSGIRWESGRFALSLDWQISSLPSLFDASQSDDILSLGFSYSTGDFLIGLDFIRRNLVSSLRHPGSLEDFFLNDDSIFSISVEKTLGHLSFRASLYTAQRYDADDEYLNGLKMEKNSTYPAFSLITSLRF